MSQEESPPDGKIVAAELLDVVTGNGEMADEDQKPIEVIIRYKSEEAADDAWTKLGGVPAQSLEEGADATDPAGHLLTDVTLGEVHEAIFGTPEVKDAFEGALSEATVDQQDVAPAARGAVYREMLKDVEVSEVHK